MDVQQIIITIAACIAGLIVLWAIIGAFILAIGARNMRKHIRESRREFNRRNGF